MKTFIQLKDGIGWASITTPEEIAGAINITGENPDDFIGKLYNNGEWEVAPTIRYALVDFKGMITEICSTVFSSVAGNNPLVTEELNLESTWNGTEWVPPIIPDFIN
jgi:hypothetical protein